jgi:N-acetylglucosaminyldiphosphoundecaprenol N-acetyl-beta-D-mannosaminyltransferase
VVLYAGRLSPEKGLGHLLGAWSRLGATPPGELLIAGDGPARQGFADLARVLGVAVRFLGFLSQPQLREVLASVRAVVLPSVCPENMPRSLVEAFSYGRPVIASDRGGLWEAVEHGSNGLQFRAGDEVELAAALRAVLEDGGLADRLGCGARASYLARYTPERNWEALQRIYRFALEHRCGAADRSRTVAAPLERRTVLGVNLTVATYREICRACRGWIEERRRAPARAVFACTVHSVMTGVLEPTFRALLNQAEVATPDGMPLVWALRSFGARQPGRVYGPNLMLFLCGQAARQGYRVYLYGGRPETLGELQRRLRARYPGLDIAGAEAPPFRPPALAEDSATVERILASGAELVFVGLGAPKQERWIAAHRERLPGLVLVGVGAAFDFHAGRIPQAPRWMQESGLEWLFRLCAEPRRLWKRYVLLNPLFLALWALQKTGLLRYPNTGSLP